jgi:hypothetical protein
MFAVEIYAAVRRFVFVEGKSRREAARVFGLSRDSMSKLRFGAICRKSSRDYTLNPTARGPANGVHFKAELRKNV